MKRKHLNSLSYGIALGFLLVGCSVTAHPTPSRTDDMTSIQARDDLANIFDGTQERLGGDWNVNDEVTPFECDTPGGAKGVQFLLTRLGSAPGSMENAEAYAKIAVDIFQSHGYPTTTSFKEELGYDVVGQNSDRSVITFGANDKAMSLQGGSSCVPGDIDAVRDEINDAQ